MVCQIFLENGNKMHSYFVLKKHGRSKKIILEIESNKSPDEGSSSSSDPSLAIKSANTKARKSRSRKKPNAAVSIAQKLAKKAAMDSSQKRRRRETKEQHVKRLDIVHLPLVKIEGLTINDETNTITNCDANYTHNDQVGKVLMQSVKKGKRKVDSEQKKKEGENQVDGESSDTTSEKDLEQQSDQAMMTTRLRWRRGSASENMLKMQDVSESVSAHFNPSKQSQTVKKRVMRKVTPNEEKSELLNTTEPAQETGDATKRATRTKGLKRQQREIENSSDSFHVTRKSIRNRSTRSNNECSASVASLQNTDNLGTEVDVKAEANSDAAPEFKKAAGGRRKRKQSVVDPIADAPLKKTPAIKSGEKI